MYICVCYYLILTLILNIFLFYKIDIFLFSLQKILNLTKLFLFDIFVIQSFKDKNFIIKL